MLGITKQWQIEVMQTFSARSRMLRLHFWYFGFSSINMTFVKNFMRKNTFLKTNFQSPSKVLMFQKNFVIWNALTVRERPFYIIKTSVLTALEYYSNFCWKVVSFA